MLLTFMQTYLNANIFISFSAMILIGGKEKAAAREKGRNYFFPSSLSFSHDENNMAAR